MALQAEIEKVRKRREERAAERALQEEELSIMQRERAVLEGIEMEAKEEEVQLCLSSHFTSLRLFSFSRPTPSCLLRHDLQCPSVDNSADSGFKFCTTILVPGQGLQSMGEDANHGLH